MTGLSLTERDLREIDDLYEKRNDISHSTLFWLLVYSVDLKSGPRIWLGVRVCECVCVWACMDAEGDALFLWAEEPSGSV